MTKSSGWAHITLLYATLAESPVPETPVKYRVLLQSCL